MEVQPYAQPGIGTTSVLENTASRIGNSWPTRFIQGHLCYRVALAPGSGLTGLTYQIVTVTQNVIHDCPRSF